MEVTSCPKCGAQLPQNAPGGICPKCLLQAGFPSEVLTGSEGSGPDSGAPHRPRASAQPGFEPPPLDKLAPLFPQLELLEFLGKGGMGAVYKARQPGLDRMVALKILPPEMGSAPSFAERFTIEARALARLAHNHIVTVYDFGQVNGLFFILMEYVEGVNLRQAIHRGKLNPEETLAIVPQICEALQFAHDEGIVHRDIKPENILLDKRGRVKIVDFGLSKILGEDTPDQNLTGTQQVMGTPRYMAPEQMRGSRNVDHRADIYSLGVVFYELLTGELPIGKFAPPSRKVHVDVRLDEVVLRALEQDPEQRYQHASEVKSAVDGIASKPAIPVTPSQSAKQPLEGPSPKINPVVGPPRFSQKAIWGAVWALFFFVFFWAMFTVQMVVEERVAEDLRSKDFQLSQAHQFPEGQLVNPPSQGQLVNPASRKQPDGPNWWQLAFAIIVIPLGLSAPIGTTVLGAMAIGNIRHSQGRIYGMPLALADALLFPLLLLDGLIFFFFYLVVSSLNFIQPDRAEMLALALALLGGAIADCWIVVKAWKKVRS